MAWCYSLRERCSHLATTPLSPSPVREGHSQNQIGKWPGSVSTVIQRSSVKLSMPALPPKRP